jgi:ectoine hydroxylase-related dioxygenase (phytanoyl-CoA dioxygenase family)
MQVESSWDALNTRGFVAVREFLSTAELGPLERAYRRSARADVAMYVAMEPAREDIAGVIEKIERLLPSIRAGTGNQTDTVIEQGTFFATDQMNLGWHADYKSYYLFQGHRHHLTFWLPVIKPLRDKSGLSVVPMDRLRERGEPVFRLIEGRGTARCENGYFHYEDGRADRHMACPVDFDEIAETPELGAGDALVMRSDLLHRTQDVRTARVSLSLRALWSGHRLTRAHLLTASPNKRKRMLGEPNAFCEVLAAFWLYRRPQMTVGELLAARRRFARKETVPRLAFAGARALLPVLLSLNGRSSS